MFIESICTDLELITANIRQVKTSSPDYLHIHPDDAAKDFLARIKHYEDAYECVGDAAEEKSSSYVKLITVGTQVCLCSQL